MKNGYLPKISNLLQFGGEILALLCLLILPQFQTSGTEKSPFSPVHTRKEGVSKTMRFQKSPLLKPFSKVSVFIGVFGHFSVGENASI